MDFAFDHLVQFVDDPKEVIAILREKGIHAVEGGEHQNRPTYNTLSYFDLSYIEFISTNDRELLEQIEHPKYSLMESIIKNGYTEGFARFVIRTTNIEEAAQYFRDQGLTVNGPVPLSRKRPDGSVLEWRLLFIGSENEELELPFIIQWNESDEERRNDLIDRGVIKPHPSGAVFSHVTFAVRDLENTVEKWASRFDLTVGDAYIDKELQANCRTLKLPGGNLVFSSPIGDGVVSEVLKKRDEKPFQVSFSGGKETITFDFFGGSYKINGQ